MRENRGTFLDKVRRKKNQALSVADTKWLRNYADESSQRALGLIDLMQMRSDCVDDDGQLTMLNRASTLIFETSNMLAGVAGPYGIPLAIGGTLLSGVLKGIGTFYANRRGFDFDEFEQRQFYAESLCHFHKFSLEVEDLLSPGKSLRGLQRLSEYMDDKLAEGRENCDHCAQILDLYADPYRDREDPSFQSEIETLRLAADAMYKHPLGSYTVNGAQIQEWLPGEVAKYEEIVSHGSQGIGPREIRAGQISLNEFLYDQWGPPFLHWHLRQARLERRYFKAHVYNWGMDFSQSIALRGLVPTAFQIREIPLMLQFIYDNKQKTESPQQFQYYDKRAWELLSLGESTLQVIDDYCDFFGDIFQYSPKIRSQCEHKGKQIVRNDFMSYRIHDPKFQLYDVAPESGGLSTFSAAAPPPQASAPKRFQRTTQENWTQGLQQALERWKQTTDKFDVRDEG